MNTKPSILVVDDNQENLKVVSSFLKEHYKIALALNGSTALKILEQIPVDLILLDIMMPEMDGYEACSSIKSIPAYKQIPIIFLSAKDNKEDIVQGFKLGAVDYVTKPFNREELLMRVSNHIDLYFSHQKLIELNRNRDKLYSIIAHDIRSPFAGIMQMIEAVSHGYVKPGTNEFFELMDILKKRSHETHNLLNNLLQWANVNTENFKLHIMPTNMFRIITECIALQLGNAADKSITIENMLSENCTAFCDEVTIHTVFRNILSNAIKFTPKGGSVTISEEQNKKELYIKVQDTGVGMDKKTVDSIFTKNDIISSKGTNNESGSGFGLVMVKDFIARNQGSIAVTSIPKQGTTITVMLQKQ